MRVKERPSESFQTALKGVGIKKKGGGFQPHPNTHTSRGKKNHLIRELALIEENWMIRACP